jgi:hypothetical protein
MVFASKSAIPTGPIHPIDHDENDAQPPVADNVWTGTGTDGTVTAGATCADWTTSTSLSSVATGTMGLRTNTDGAWTQWGSGGGPCSAISRLYCFEL